MQRPKETIHYTENQRWSNVNPTENRGELRFHGRIAVPVPHVELVVLLLLQTR
jgi:hypothetical protein